MINKLKIGFLIAVLSLTVTSVASAADLTWSSNTIVAVNGRNYTILSGSTATSYVIDATTLTVTVPASSTFSLLSGGDSLATDLNLTQNCSGSGNSVTVTGAATAVITPSSTQCTAPAGGGAIITGGGGGGTVTVAPSGSTTSTVAQSATPVTISISPTVTMTTNDPGCSGGNKYNTSTGALCNNNVVVTGTTFSVSDLGTLTLRNGSKGESVKQLQKVLNKILNANLAVDGKLGPKTIAKIKVWQKAQGLVADGLVGKLTKAKLIAEANK